MRETVESENVAPPSSSNCYCLKFKITNVGCSPIGIFWELNKADQSPLWVTDVVDIRLTSKAQNVMNHSWEIIFGHFIEAALVKCNNFPGDCKLKPSLPELPELMVVCSVGGVLPAVFIASHIAQPDIISRIGQNKS